MAVVGERAGSSATGPQLSPMSAMILEMGQDLGDEGIRRPEGGGLFVQHGAARSTLRQGFIFLPPVPASMHCSICKDVFLEPVETTEGQVFCRDCITTWLVRERGTTCPLSSQPLTLEELKASRVLEAVIDDLRVRCKGCSTVMPHGSIGSHLGSCVAGTPCHGPAAALAERNGAREVVGSLKSASGSLGAEWNTPTRECTTPVMPRMGKENGVGWSTPSAMGAVASPAKKGKDNKARNLKQGVVFERYVGVFDKLPDFDAITPAESGIAQQIGLDSVPGVEAGGVALRFFGVLRIPVSGEYVFSLGSNDGSRLLIADKVIADNDGVHYFSEISGATTLPRGDHSITVEYFYTAGKSFESVRGGMNLTCRYSHKGEGWRNSGGFTQVDIPEQLLFHDVEDCVQSQTRVDEGSSLRLAAAARAENRQLKQEQIRSNKQITQLTAEVTELRAAAAAAKEAKLEAEKQAQLEQIEVAQLRRDAHTLQAQVHDLQASGLQQRAEAEITQEQFFCALALAIKLQLPGGATVTLNNTELYARCRAAQIPSDQWPQFIMDALR